MQNGYGKIKDHQGTDELCVQPPRDIQKMNRQNSAGPYFLGRDGGPYVTIDLLDKDLVAMLDKLKPGEYSQPVVFEENGKKGVRIVHYKSRTRASSSEHER